VLDNHKQVEALSLVFDSSVGRAEEAAAPFEWLLQGSYSYTHNDDLASGVAPFWTNDDGYRHDTSLGLSKTWRLGTRIAVTATDQFERNPVTLPLGDDAGPKASLGQLSFTVAQPLLRGFRCGADRAREQAFSEEMRADYFQSLYDISALVRDSINTYWGLAAAIRQVEVLRRAECRFEDLLGKTEKLIDYSVIAPSEVHQPIFQLAQQRRDLRAAEDTVRQLWYQLLYLMGCELSYPVDPLSLRLDALERSIDQGMETCLPRFPELLYQAKDQRWDLRASQHLMCSAQALAAGAENDFLPQLDLVLRADQTGTQANASRYASRPFYLRKGQRDYSVAVEFSTPLPNNAGRGRIQRFAAESLRLQRLTELLEDQIEAEVLSSCSEIQALVEQYAEQGEMLEQSRILVENEQKRVQAGLSTLFIVIDFQNRLTSAELGMVALQRDFAQALSDHLFITGRLLQEDCGLCALSPQQVLWDFEEDFE
jgi:outer membrane protein TolC